jgi:V/A-type H+/Na+-transporting ATPase subunit D
MPERALAGRAGRLLLRRRIAATKRSLELLDRKRRFLKTQRELCEGRHLESAQQWARRCGEADAWTLRAAVLGGTEALSAAGAEHAGRGEARIWWRDTMGVRHPDETRCRLEDLSPKEIAAANGAMGPVAAAFGSALVAAVEHAAATRSLDAVTAELRATESRLRAIERRRLPDLEAALHLLELRLEELEREEQVVNRRVRERRADTRESGDRISRR